MLLYSPLGVFIKMEVEHEARFALRAIFRHAFQQEYLAFLCVKNKTLLPLNSQQALVFHSDKGEFLESIPFRRKKKNPV